MIFSCFAAALGQLPDPRFLRVVVQGVALAVALLVAIFLGLLGLVEWVVPGQISLPFIGPINGLGIAAGVGLAVAVLLASVFLMVPVATAFSAMFLDQVADAVEALHYPGQTAHPTGVLAGLVDGAALSALLVMVNLVAFAFSFVLGPFGPVLFWAVNGWFLGREYFKLAALRHLDKDAARSLMRQNSGTVWLAGTLMAAPLSLPFVSLLVPVLGAATFTHLFQRLRQD